MIVSISDASGSAYGVRLLELLQDTEIETHLVLSKAGQVTLASELDHRTSEIQALADFVHYQVFGLADASADPDPDVHDFLTQTILPR